MKETQKQDPFDVLGEAYETMYERAVANLHKVKEKTGPLLHELVDEAKNKAVQLEELTEEDASQLAEWLKRDLDDAVSYLADGGHELKDWLGFETRLIESTLLDMMLQTADKTTVELLKLKQNQQRPYAYQTGEITGPGSLICDECGKTLHFHKPSRIPPCPECHGIMFHR